VTGIIEEAGQAATPHAPLAWLRMEPGMEPGMEPRQQPASNDPEVRLRIYPGVDQRVIATTTFHAAAVRWMAAL
jgi:hypothetical protein